MAKMVYGHPRSRSTLLMQCFHNNLNEIFDLRSVDKNTFKYAVGINAAESPEKLQQSDFAKEYLKYLKSNIDFDSSGFKVFYHSIYWWPEARDFIVSLNPSIIVIKRDDRLAALKSILIAMRRGFHVTSEREAQPFNVDFAEFQRTLMTVDGFYKLGYAYFRHHVGIAHEMTFENFFEQDFNLLIENGLLDAPMDNMSLTKNQQSSNHYSLIMNENQIDSWYYMSTLA